MRIAFLYPYGALGCAWNVSDGVTNTLRRMGHDVTPYPMYVVPVPGAKTALPPVEVLNEYDMVLLVGLEWLEPILRHLYPGKLANVEPPVVSWYTESSGHEQNFDYSNLLRWADYHYYPACQDAEYVNGDRFGECVSFLPFGVDTEMFNLGNPVEKAGAAFVGHVYGVREQFLSHPGNKIPVITRVAVRDTKRRVLVSGQDAGGLPVPGIATTQMYAEQLRRLKLCINLPSMSKLTVTRVFEAMACGTAVLTPVSENRGNDIFTTGDHVAYYDPKTTMLLRSVHLLMSYPEDVEIMAKRGHEEVMKNHKLEDRLAIILRDVERGHQ